MRYELRSIMAEIETLQHNAHKTGRHVEVVYLKEGEMDEFALECKAYKMEDDPRRGGDFRWKGTQIKRDTKT